MTHKELKWADNTHERMNSELNKHEMMGYGGTNESMWSETP